MSEQETNVWASMMSGAHNTVTAQAHTRPVASLDKGQPTAGPDNDEQSTNGPDNNSTDGPDNNNEKQIWGNMYSGAQQEYVSHGSPHDENKNQISPDRDAAENHPLENESVDEVMIRAVEAHKKLVTEKVGSSAEVEGLYEAALRINPDHMQSLIRYGVYLMGNGELTRAAKYLSHATTIDDPDRVHAERAYHTLNLKKRMTKDMKLVKAAMLLGVTRVVVD